MLIIESLYDALVGKSKVSYKEATTLFTLIEDGNWQESIRCAKRYPNEARTWVYRNEDNRGGILWKMLPLHAAITLEAPVQVVRAVVDAYPAAAKEKDDQGNLPIHLASNHYDPDDEVIAFLIGVYPEGIGRNDGMKGLCIVDYDHNSPELHKLILIRSWQEVVMRVDIHPIEAATWTLKMDRNGRVELRFLAIHLAIAYDAPLPVIESLIKAFPQSIKCVDDKGMIPLKRELSKKNQRREVLRSLLKSMIYTEGGMEKFTTNISQHIM